MLPRKIGLFASGFGLAMLLATAACNSRTSESATAAPSDSAAASAPEGPAVESQSAELQKLADDALAEKGSTGASEAPADTQ